MNCAEDIITVNSVNNDILILKIFVVDETDMFMLSMS